MGAATGLKPQTPPTADLTPRQPSASLAPANDLKSAMGEADARIQQDEAKRGSLTMPTLADMPPMPQAQNTPPANIWGSAAMAMAAIGSLMTRQPMTAALNSAAGVMKAFKQGDMDMANAEFARWKVASENALKVHNFQMEQYKAALSEISSDERTAMAKLKTLAVTFHDTNMEKIADSRNAIAAKHLVLDQERFAAKMTEEAPKVAQGFEFQRNFAELKKDPAFQNATPQDRAVMMAQIMPGGAGLTKKTALFEAQNYLITGKMGSFGMGGTANRTVIMNLAAQLAEEMGKSPAEIAAIRSGYQSDTASLRNITKIADAAEGYEKSAMATLNLALDYAKKGGIPSNYGTWANALQQWVKTGTGDPNMPPYFATLLTGANEFAKVTSGSTGAQAATEGARAEAAKIFAKPYNYDQLKAAVKAARQDMDFKRQYYRDQAADIKARISGSISKPSGKPTAGEVHDGYRFKGGDPADQDNWEQEDDQ